MSRWQTYGQGDTRELRDGDARFLGLDMVRDRGSLQQGMLAVSQNKRLRKGSADTRPGTDTPGDFNPIFGNAIVGSAIYTNPNGDEVMLVAVLNDNKVWVLQHGKDAVTVNLTGGQDFTNTFAAEFVQSFDKVMILRRPAAGRPQMVWNGVAGDTFDPIALSTYGRKLIPITWFGQPFKDRLILYSAYRPDLPWRDQVIVTDPGDYTSYDEVFGSYRINSGESDYITRVWPYFREGVVVFKSRSIHLLQNFTLDPTLALRRLVSYSRGAVGNKCVTEVGNDVLFLSEPGGIYRLQEVITEQIATEPVAVSEPIQPIIDRINWTVAALWASAETFDVYTYFFVPLDTSPKCNCAIVYNNASRQIESVDTWEDPTFGIHALHITLFDRKRRLYGVDYEKARIYLLYEGISDDLGAGPIEIKDAIETRGYAADFEFKRFQRTQIGVATFNPEINVTAIADGYNEKKLITETPITKDPFKFYPHGHDDYVQNVGDPDEQLREDYSIGDSVDFAGQDYESLLAGAVTSIPGTGGTVASPKQQSIERMELRQNGRWVSLRIENTKGVCDVLAIGVDATQVSEGVAAIA